MIRRLAAAIVAVSSLFSSAAPAQDGPDAALQLDKYERYLERKPYHEWAFEQMVGAAVQANALPTLVASYEARAGEGGTTADRIVLARLYAHVDRVDEALEGLRAVEQPPAALLQLIGALELRRGDAAAAVAALDAALLTTDVRAELEALHRLRGEAHLAAGDTDGARQAFQALSALDPGDFHLRLEAAEALSRHGLAAPALVELREAQRIAGEDTARRCRVMAEIGRLHEQLAEGEEALAVYDEAIGLMSRGNWLKRGLQERVVALHRRTDSLAALVERAATAVEAAPHDLDALEFHARALREAERTDEALAVLTVATETFPGDVALARSRIELLRAADDDEGVIAEYQRILGEKPDELDLYLELGQAFAASGQLEQARRQWRKTLDERLDDPGLASRLAGMYALYDQPDDAIALYEKAVALEPKDVSRYADLATYLNAVGRADDIAAVLERAEAAAGSAADPLDEVAVLWREFGEPERARTLIERALAAEPDNVRLLGRLADAQLEGGDLAGASESLHGVIARASEVGTRRTAVDRLIRAWRGAGRQDELRAAERAAAAAPDATPSHALVLGRLHVRDREPQAALEVYGALIESAPELEEAREALAKLLEEAGDLEGALAQYDALIEARPQNRRKYLKELAALHLERFDQEAAFACYDEILSSSTDNPAAFREVGAAYEKLGLLDEAIECYLQAVRLDPSDGRTRLELAELFRSTGEWQRSEREIVAAFDAQDEQTSKRARARYHAVLSEEGRIEEEIEDLRARIERNPYDLAAPVTLTDIYARELEYQLALDMLDELLSYQPSEPKLLAERARILTLLERYGEATVVYEALLRLPGANRAELAVDIADAQIKKGDRARAEEVMAQAGDPEALARLYQRNDLPELALETLEAALARRPGDTRLLDRLARLKERVRDRDGAVAAVERMVELRGESWRLLKRLGQLYHDAGRQEEALATGRRLFALIRIEDVPAPRDEDEEAEQSGRPVNPFTQRRTYWRGASAYDARVDELRSWYQAVDVKDVFTEVAAEELRRQPTNDKLLSVVVADLTREEDRGAEIEELVSMVRSATLDADRLPGGKTADAWRRQLEGYSGRITLKDVAWGRARVEELRAQVAAGDAPAIAHRELADLLLDLGENQACLAALEAGVAAHPDDPHLRTGLASQLQREREFEQAAAEWRALIGWLEASGATDERPADERELAYRAGRIGLMSGFPIHVQRRLSEEDLRRHYELGQSRSIATSWALGSMPVSPTGARMQLARCLHEAGDDEGARAELVALEEHLGVTDVVREDPTRVPLQDAARLANLWAELDFDAEAKVRAQRLMVLEEELGAHPLHGFNRSWAGFLYQSRKQLAKILEREGDLAGAYDLLREQGANDEAKLLLEEKELHEELLTFYERRAAELADLGAHDRWRDEMVKLAEVRQHQRRWTACRETYEAIAAREPEDFAVRTAVAMLLEREGQWEEAVAVHESIVVDKRAVNRRSARPAEPPPVLLTPIEVPRAEGDGSWVWSNLRNAGRWGARTPGKESVTENYAAILKLLLDQREVERATEVMRRIAREDARNISWLGSTLAEVVEQYRLEAEGVPILRLLHTHNQGDENVAIRLGHALMAAKRFDEARRVYRELIDSTATQSYYRDEATRQLEVAEKRLGIDSSETLADLEAAVESDPKNAKARLKLARRLLEDEEDERALEQALAAEAVAPHLDEVRALTRRLLQLNGRHAECEARLLDSLDDISDEDDLVVQAARIADWMAERGELEQVDALFERIRRQNNGWFRYTSPATWFLRRGEVEQALTELRADLDGADAWYKDEIEVGISRLESALGDPTAAIDASWSTFEKAKAKGDRGLAIPALVRPVCALSDDPAALERLAAQAAARGGLRGELELAAVELARGDALAAETRLVRLARAEPANVFLYPTLVDLARTREDLAAALAYLEELQGLGVVSESSMVSSGLGFVAEADLLRAEIGALRLAVGDRAGADAVWAEMFEPDDEQGAQVFAKLYALAELWDEALAAQRRFLEESGTRNQQALQELADLQHRAGDPRAALESFERVLLLLDGNDFRRNQIVSRVMRLYREADLLDERRATLSERIAADPNDVTAMLELGRLEAEAGDEARAEELLAAAAERPDQTETVAPALIRAARMRGDLDAACAWYRKMLAGNAQEWTRRNLTQEYAKLLVERGEVDEAVRAMRDAYPDPDGTEALNAALGMLEGQRRYGEALELLPELEALSKEPDETLARRVRCLDRLERSAEALDLLRAAIVDAERRDDWMFAEYARLAGELEEPRAELKTVEEALDSAPDDAGLRVRWLALQTDDEHAERRAQYLSDLLTAAPDDTHLREQLARALVAAKRHAEALPHLEALLEQLDRERARTGENDDWQVRNRITSLRSLRADALLYAEGADAALAARLDHLGRRYEVLNQWDYRTGREVDTLGVQRLSALQTMGLDERFLQEYDKLAPELRLASTYNRARLRRQAWELRYRMGEREAVLEELWEATVRHAPVELAAAPTSRTFPVFEQEAPVLPSDHPARTLIAFYREEERLGELEARLVAAVESHPDHPILPAALEHLRETKRRDAPDGADSTPDEEQDDEQLARLRKTVEEDPFDPNGLVQLARHLVTKGEGAEALELLLRAEPMVRGLAYSAVEEFDLIEQSGPPQDLRFRFASTENTSFGSSTSYRTNDGSQSYGLLLRVLAAAYFAAGEREQGLACEERVERLGTASQGGWIYDPFTQQWTRGSPTLEMYVQLGLGDEVERVAEEQLEEIAREEADDAAAELRRRGEQLDQVVRAFAGDDERPRDEARWSRWVARRRAAWDELVAAKPDDLKRREGRAAWLLASAEDEDAWRAEVEWLRTQPEWLERAPKASTGWMYLQLGEVADARAQFEAVAAERKPSRSVTAFDSTDAGLALCRHLEGDAPGARPELMRAWVHANLDEAARELVRAALGF